MTITRAQVNAFAKAHPRPNTWPNAVQSNTDWDNDCALFMFRLGQTYVDGWAPAIAGPTAYDVYLRSKIIGTRAADAFQNSIHWFSDSNGGGGYKSPRPGHVMFDELGGGTSCASATVSESGSPISGVAHLRRMSVAAYLAEHKDIHYLGWSMDYAGARYTKSNLAGGGVKPLPQPKPEAEDEMSDYNYSHGKDTQGDKWALTHPLYLPNGILTTRDVNVARGWAPFTGDGGSELTDEQWTAMIAQAKVLSDLAIAQVQKIFPGSSGGTVEIPNPLPVVVTNFPDTPEVPDPVPPTSGTTFTAEFVGPVDLKLTPKG